MLERDRLQKPAAKIITKSSDSLVMKNFKANMRNSYKLMPKRDTPPNDLN